MQARSNAHDGVPTLPALQLLAHLYGDFPSYLQRVARERGPIVRFRGVRSSIYLVTEPGAIEEVLVSRGTSFEKSRGARRLRQIVGNGLLTSDEPMHLAHRRLAQPAFHRKRIAAFARTMAEKSMALVDAWRDGEEIDVDAQTNRLALEIVSSTLFGSDLSSDMATISSSLDVSMGMFHFWETPFTEIFDDWPLPNVVRFKAARDRLRAIVDRMIAERRAAAANGDDVLSLLLSARDADGRGGLDDAEVRDEALTILLAGHETTANALAWAVYLLQRHPGVRDELERSVDAVLANRIATFDDVPQLDYVRAVFAESMRLYPPAWVTSREALEPVTIGGVSLAPGDVAIVSQYVTHRDPRFWNDPERFDPKRFLGEPARERFAYFPFGGGSRMCIGESFAWTEGVIALATLASRVRLERAGTGDVSVLGRVTLRPREPIVARVVRRTEKVS